MLTEDKLLQIFNEETSGKRHTEGQRVLNNDLVSSLDITSEDNLICINANVISENLFNEYNSKIEMDTEKRNILSTFCSCADFEKFELKKKNYCCKHLVAVFYKALDSLISHPLLSGGEHEDNNTIASGLNILDLLLGDEKDKEDIKIEVYINKDEWSDNLSVELKIGLSSMSSSNLYTVKDINQFLVALHNNVPISYSKNFTFNIKEQRLSTKDKRLIAFVEKLKDIEGKYKYLKNAAEKVIEGKYVNIPDGFVREFFYILKDHRIYLNEGFFFRPVETEILEQYPPIDFDLKIIKDNYVLKSPNGMPRVLGSERDVFLYGTILYLPDYSFTDMISPYLRIFNQSKVVTIPCSEENVVLRRLIPELNSLSSNVTLTKSIKDKILTAACKFAFYFDMEDRNISLILKVKYGAYEFNIFEECSEKIIYRDSKRELEVIGRLKSLGFEEYKRKFHLLMDDDYIYRFFKNEIGKLQEIGEIYYSENFKGIKSIGAKGITGDIKSGKYDYFEMEFQIGDVSSKETVDILRAFRDNLKYYKLKDGHYLDLEELELRSFLKLLNTVSMDTINENKIIIPKTKGIYLDNYLEEKELRFIKGKKELGEITSKLKEIDKLNFEIPQDLEGNLREYQKIGYNWFKTLDYLGFGGILGDEMGLGKTLQTITFILSNKGSKSLIVAPTSLVYNWTNEFEKFAPTVRVAAVNGAKEDREAIINNIESYDVLITTYNLLKRDQEIYKNLEFDYCVLDEAQNIKNLHSQNAISAKEIKAKRKFALSGTPVENSLMELWSIFDFILPGYLFDEKRFSVRYHKKLREDPEVLEEVNKLIKPFILRRRKKEVIMELPDKIEKTLMITMDDEQKMVYKTYLNYALELIAKKVKDDEFKSSKIEILSYITKLRQLCLDPSVLMNNYKGGSAKLEALVELLQQSIEEGHRILVFSQFTSVLKNIGKRLETEGISFSYLDGSISSEMRMKMVKNFNQGENSVFLISLKAGGTGLNLTSADIVVHFDPWWNPAVEEQATDRAHRIGQKNIVEVIKIIAKGTIEEKILSLQLDKKKLISEIMGDDLSGAENFSTLSEDQVLELFSSIPI